MPAPLHHEARFEEEVCEHLAAHGWFYAPGDHANADAETSTYPNDLVGWVRDTQPDLWEQFEQRTPPGASALEAFPHAVRKAIDRTGTVRALREGVRLTGLRRRVQLAQFRPASGLNEELQRAYAANRLRVVRQVRFSTRTNQSLDLVLYLNGVPVATAELKTELTQALADAVEQYRRDRPPNPKGSPRIPLLTPGTGAVVHFAVGTDAVEMTTKLAGEATRFLPFNRGTADGGAGNPIDGGGYGSRHLWERVWERGTWLDLLGRYAVEERDAQGRLKSVVFPRYHQLDATAGLLAAVKRDGPGGRYLIQHSAGSGKTKSIAWSAHFLSTLHDGEDQKVFDTVLVVSDRRQIDKQLGDALRAMERVQGVVAVLESGGSSKSSRLAAALAAGKKVVVCTMQTFPHALEEARSLSATEGKRFAVIADEAHSGQAGEAANKLKDTLAGGAGAADDGEGLSAEDLLAGLMERRAARTDALTYVAFTATPKAKTLELFGTPGSDNGGTPRPFHLYPMRQAIEEGFILDVLTNYLAYDEAFRLGGGEDDDGWEVREVGAKEAGRRLRRRVRLHPHNIAQKVKVVVEHFDRVVAPLLGGEARAMVVTGSRKEAVRWQLALQAELREQELPYRSFVAFSGEVDDPESGPEPFAEGSAKLNPGLNGRDVAEAFDQDDDARVLVVADKYQTGFDQPKLCAMYVDKRLAGVQAVQTLSRLNRSFPGKDRVYVLDFVDQADEVLAAFRVYHKEAELSGVTDPDLVTRLAERLGAAGAWDAYEVDRVVKALTGGKAAKQGDLLAAIKPVAERLKTRYAGAEAVAEKEALLGLRSDAAAYVKAYAFLSQLYDYGDPELEKLAVFLRVLGPTLRFEREREEVDLSGVDLTHHRLTPRAERDLGLGGPPPAGGGDAKLAPMEAVGTAAARAAERARLAEVVAKLNALFADCDGLTDADAVNYLTVVRDKVAENPVIVAQAKRNTPGRFAASPELAAAVEDATIGAADAHQAMSGALLGDPAKLRGFVEALLGAGLQATLKEAGG